jgi:peptidoglycan/LPS O-acetylase OafA/YrhL
MTGGANEKAAPRIPALDGVRALAVIGVISSHSGLFALGWVGVDIFFALSGYLITGILLDAKATAVNARGYFVPFYMRRALRILPLAWGFAILMAALRNEWRGLPWYMGFVVNWFPHSPPPRDLGHYWSLAVEEQFYLVWPAVVFSVSRGSLLRISVGIIALNVLCRLSVSLWPPDFANEQFRGLATFARSDTLLIGALLAQRERSAGWGREVAWALPVALVAGLLFVALRKFEVDGGAPILVYNIKWPLLALGIGAGLLFVLTKPPKLLQWGWLVWIGKVSYGVYVIHALFGRWLHEHFTLAQAPLMFLIQLGLTLPLAAISWHFFEAPILKLKRLWPMPSARTASPAGVSAVDRVVS